MNILEKLKRNHHPHSGALELLKYIGPGLLVTVGFIDPGNWATNLAAGSEFGYALLWVVTFSSIMLIIIQHNVAHLGIVTGLCLSEATTQYLPKKLSLPILISAMMASISRDIRWRHCLEDVIQYSYQSRSCYCNTGVSDYVAKQYLQQNRTLDHHVRFHHRTFLPI